MSRLYDVPICNFIGQPFQWLREMADQERAHDPVPHSIPAPPRIEAPAPRLASRADLEGPRWEAAVAHDPGECDPFAGCPLIAGGVRALDEGTPVALMVRQAP
jgi:hypothetical protein